MARKTRKQSLRSRRRTIRRYRKTRRGGADSQPLQIPSSAFGPKIGAPVNSTDAWYKIA